MCSEKIDSASCLRGQQRGVFPRANIIALEKLPLGIVAHARNDFGRRSQFPTYTSQIW